MMKYPIGRPLTLEEIKKPLILQDRSSWLVEVAGSKRLCLVGQWILLNALLVEFLAAYGASWRIWPYRPTQERREAHPWGIPDTSKDGHTLTAQIVRILMRPYNDLTRYHKTK